MPFPRHQLDLLICPQPPHRSFPKTELEELLRQWRIDGYLSDEDQCINSHRNALIEGGFSRVFIDCPESMRFYANHQGGYSVRCPDTKENIVPEFVVAMKEWRASGAFVLECPRCRATHPLDDLDFRPDAAFAMGALVFQNVQSIVLQQILLAQLNEVFCNYAIILKRVG